MTVSIMALDAECSYADCRYAESRYAECRYAECLNYGLIVFWTTTN
jgi:hypothetical protein